MNTTCRCNERTAHHEESFKEDLLNRLKRIEGQVRGVQQMIDRDVYCDDVLTQIAAIRSALTSVSEKLFDAHLKSCITYQLQSGNMEVLDELIQTIKRMMK